MKIYICKYIYKCKYIYVHICIYIYVNTYVCVCHLHVYDMQLGLIPLSTCHLLTPPRPLPRLPIADRCQRRTQSL